jgi:hypothetical protein
MLKSAKDQILGVDTPGQHVPPHVRYGMACWAGLVWLYLRDRKVQEGLEGILLYPIEGNLSNYERGLRVFYYTQQGETYDKAWHTICG